MYNEKKYKASLSTKKDRDFYLVVITWYDDNGKRQRKTVTTSIEIKGNNKRKAQAECSRIEDEWNNGFLSSGDVLFSDYYKQWLEKKRREVRTSTYEGYNIIANAHILPYFSQKELKLNDITANHINAYIDFKKQTLSGNTIRKHLINLKQCFDKAVSEGLISNNPAEQIKMPKTEKFYGAKVFSAEQIEVFLKAIENDCLEVLLLFTLFYGLRRSEILGLKWSAISFVENVFTIQHTVVQINKELLKEDNTKTEGSRRSYPIPPLLIEKLKEVKHRQNELKELQPNDYVDEGYVFTDVFGKIYRPQYISTHYKWILRTHGLPDLRFHDLRHSSATILLKLGCSFKEIQEWLGHENIATTMNTYTHLDLSSKQAISNILIKSFESFTLRKEQNDFGSVLTDELTDSRQKEQKK